MMPQVINREGKINGEGDAGSPGWRDPGWGGGFSPGPCPHQCQLILSLPGDINPRAPGAAALREALQAGPELVCGPTPNLKVLHPVAWPCTPSRPASTPCSTRAPSGDAPWETAEAGAAPRAFYFTAPLCHPLPSALPRGGSVGAGDDAPSWPGLCRERSGPGCHPSARLPLPSPLPTRFIFFPLFSPLGGRGKGGGTQMAALCWPSTRTGRDG